MKRLQEGFLLELTASVEVYKAKIEEISEELQRLVSENEAFRNQLAYYNIEPGNMVSPDWNASLKIWDNQLTICIATIPIDTPGFRGYGATADEMQYIKVWF